MARRPRDYAAEERRRNELARQRGYANRSQQRKARHPRDYRAERQRRDELAQQRGYRNLADQTRKRKLGVIAEAMEWASYRLLFPRASQRTQQNAAEFMSGLGTMGGTGDPNRNGGFVATAQQRLDRDHFVRQYVADSSIEAFGERYELGRSWWAIWREEYADKYL